jgi:translation initiation factor IF-2
MSKIRINDLARELEVKSKAILDALPEVGVTEKKTHSSSVEEHEAEKLRAYLRAANEAHTAARPSRPSRADGDEIKTKIDLSNISRPGDVLNAIRKQQAPTAPVTSAVRPVAAASPTVVPPPSTVKAPPPPPTAPAPRVIVPSTAVRPTFSVPTPPVAPPPASIATPPTIPVPARPTSPPAATPPVAQASAPSSAAPPSVAQPPAPTAARPAAPIAPVRPQPPSPRMIVPHTGPRPVYQAPIRPAAPSQAGASTRPVPGRPVPGSASGRCCGSRYTSSLASRGASTDASNPAVAYGHATSRSWTRIASAGHDPSRRSSGCASA